jgi:hypothetical protein
MGALTFEETLNELQGMLGTEVAVTICDETGDIAGFEGRLWRSYEPKLSLPQSGPEAMYFMVEPGAMFMLDPERVRDVRVDSQPGVGRTIKAELGAGLRIQVSRTLQPSDLGR